MSYRPAITALLFVGLFAVGSRSLAAQETFEFQLLNRSYEAFIQDLAPVVIGPATVLLSSPEHSLTLARHQAKLTPLGAGEHRIELELRLSGRGTLDADVRMGAIRSQLSDQLAVPAQTIALSGRAVVTKGDGGYYITTRELTPEVEVRIESQLARRMFKICHQMVLVLINLDCTALEQSLTYIKAPLPPAGETYWLPADELTVEEQKRFDVYLLRDQR